MPGQGLTEVISSQEREVRLRAGQGCLSLRERVQAGPRRTETQRSLDEKKRKFFEKYDLGKIKEIDVSENPPLVSAPQDDERGG